MVVSKECNACGRISYSLSEKGAWICPHCGHDLAALPFLATKFGSLGVLPVKIDNHSLFSPN